jgi:ABC-type antimicrobial peptide transport system permease subunit
MTEAKMNKEILSKVGDLTTMISKSFADAFSVDASRFGEAFHLKYSEEEITRVITSMLSNKESNAKNNLISFGYQDLEEPTYISFYFNSFDGKEHFLKFLDNYNEKALEDKKLNFTDTTGILMNSIKTIVNAVSYVLIGFVSISLVVSSFMIGIITYISVFERTKEIGILRAIGASKGNISSIFNAETFIIGLLSGIFGIGISYLLIPIINIVIHHFTGNIPLSATLLWNNAFLLVLLSIILTLIGGLIPARSASKKDPVEALRSE